jgi:hypothetical protein
MDRWDGALAWIAAALVAGGCGPAGGTGAGGGSQAGSDASDRVVTGLMIDVSGTAAIHPAAAAWMSDRMLPLPALEGFTVRLEEPFRSALQDPNPLLGQAAIAAAGAFTVRGVDTHLLSFGGIAAALAGGDASAQPILVPSRTVVFDVRLHDSLPEADLTGVRVWAVPRAYEEQLTAAVSPARIQDLTARQAASLVQAGFVLGRVVDSQGNAVAGASIETDPPALGDRVFYPSADLAGVTQGATASNGLFVYVHTAGAFEPFAFRVKDRPEYGWRNGGVALGTGLVVSVYPGMTPPP